MATLNQLKRMTARAYRRVGRGQASSRGKQSGRGGKGQTARAGNKRRPELRDIIKKLPKLRGHGKNRGRTHVPRPAPIAISLEKLEKMFENGEQVTRKALMEKGALRTRGDNRVKIVGGGTLTKTLIIKDVPMSASAKAAIESAGGGPASGGKAGGSVA